MAKKLTKRELRVLERQTAARADDTVAPMRTDTFGELPLIQSQSKSDRTYTAVAAINHELQGETLWVRGHLQSVRARAKIAFLTLRQQTSTVQAVLLDESDMIAFARGIPNESIVDALATVTRPDKEITGTTQRNVELRVLKLFVLSMAQRVLPFQIEDAARSDALVQAAGSKYVRVGLDTRLNARVLDLRTLANQAIMRVQAAVGQLFREFLAQRDFVEIHTPKLVGDSVSARGGFSLKYFGQDACLAQSPQLYTQMACACSGLERVFEIGPVFRAVNANTHNHMCEFTGLDLEMAIKEHYHEVLHMFSDLLVYIFDSLGARFRRQLSLIREQHPFEPLKYNKPLLVITFEEGVAMLQAAGAQQDLESALSIVNERLLGRLLNAEYDTDLYVLDRLPLAVRPFYTMADPKDKRWSNSFDVMLRGEKILSGAQHVHDATLLSERVDAMDVPKEGLKLYIDSFKYGALPHGGGGIGLERLVMLYLGLGNIRQASMFPRDPYRLFP